MKIGIDIDEKIDSMNGYLNSIMLNDNQLNKFLNKLNITKLKDFQLLLDYNRYSYDRLELISYLNEKVSEFLKLKEKKVLYDLDIVDDLIDNLEIFNTKELYFLHNLFSEAEYFTSDSYITIDYPEIHEYYMSSLLKLYNELSNRSNKRKLLKKEI